MLTHWVITFEIGRLRLLSKGYCAADSNTKGGGAATDRGRATEGESFRSLQPPARSRLPDQSSVKLAAMTRRNAPGTPGRITAGLRILPLPIRCYSLIRRLQRFLKLNYKLAASHDKENVARIHAFI